MCILLNADLGEMGLESAVDRALMPHLDIANIACGGHAGDASTVKCFTDLAQSSGVRITAHISYADKANFGRRPMNLPWSKLRASLDQQRDLLPDAQWLKFHGALYNQACKDQALADQLTEWINSAGFTTVLTLPGSALAQACEAIGLVVLVEGFVERRYQMTEQGLQLVGRQHAVASIDTLAEASQQAKQMIELGHVDAFTDAALKTTQPYDCTVETLCIHSDAAIAVPLAKAIREVLDEKNQ